MSTGKSAAEGHLCQSRCLSAAPHTSLFYRTHFECLVEAGLVLSHQFCDAKELNNAPKTQDSRSQSMRGSVLQVMQPKAKQIPKVTHTITSVSHFWRFCHSSWWGRRHWDQVLNYVANKQWDPLAKEVWTNTFTWYVPCPMASPPLFSRCAAQTPGTALDLIDAAPYLPISILDLMFSEPGRSILMLSVSFYWAVQGRI